MKYLIALWLVGSASVAYASCTYNSYTDSTGRYVTCTTCCYSGSCSTYCY